MAQRSGCSQIACVKRVGTRILASLLSFLLVFAPETVYAQNVFVASLPEPGKMLGPTEAFVPVLTKGLVVHPDQPLHFDFIVDSGNETRDAAFLKAEGERVVKYFLAALTVPAEDLWVNLSPYEHDRIIADALGGTDLGRDMLAQDYILKQLTASLIDPDKDLGKKFWAEVYAKAQEKFGTTDIPIDTFNKVWIAPDVAEVYEKSAVNGQPSTVDGPRLTVDGAKAAVYVTRARMKVLLDADYVAFQESAVNGQPSAVDSSRLTVDSAGSNAADSSQAVTRDILREVVIPVLEKEINEGAAFAPLRQIYHAAILAKWYRETIQKSLLSKVYLDQNRIKGVDVDDKTLKEQIYQRYIDAYKKGVFNFIREESAPSTDNSQQSTVDSGRSLVDGSRLTGDDALIPRKYFSGGVSGFGKDIKLARQDVFASAKVGSEFAMKVALLTGDGASLEADKELIAPSGRLDSPNSPQESVLQNPVDQVHNKDDPDVQVGTIHVGDVEVRSNLTWITKRIPHDLLTSRQIIKLKKLKDPLLRYRPQEPVSFDLFVSPIHHVSSWEDPALIQPEYHRGSVLLSFDAHGRLMKPENGWQVRGADGAPVAVDSTFAFLFQKLDAHVGKAFEARSEAQPHGIDGLSDGDFLDAQLQIKEEGLINDIPYTIRWKSFSGNPFSGDQQERDGLSQKIFQIVASPGAYAAATAALGVDLPYQDLGHVDVQYLRQSQRAVFLVSLYPREGSGKTRPIELMAKRGWEDHKNIFAFKALKGSGLVPEFVAQMESVYYEQVIRGKSVLAISEQRGITDEEIRSVAETWAGIGSRLEQAHIHSPFVMDMNPGNIVKTDERVNSSGFVVVDIYGSDKTPPNHRAYFIKTLYDHYILGRALKNRPVGSRPVRALLEGIGDGFGRDPARVHSFFDQALMASDKSLGPSMREEIQAFLKEDFVAGAQEHTVEKAMAPTSLVEWNLRLEGEVGQLVRKIRQQYGKKIETWLAAKKTTDPMIEEQKEALETINRWLEEVKQPVPEYYRGSSEAYKAIDEIFAEAFSPWQESLQRAFAGQSLPGEGAKALKPLLVAMEILEARGKDHRWDLALGQFRKVERESRKELSVPASRNRIHSGNLLHPPGGEGSEQAMKNILEYVRSSQHMFGEQVIVSIAEALSRPDTMGELEKINAGLEKTRLNQEARMYFLASWLFYLNKMHKSGKSYFSAKDVQDWFQDERVVRLINQIASIRHIVVPVTRRTFEREKDLSEGGDVFDWLMEHGYFEEQEGDSGVPRLLTEQGRIGIEAMYPDSQQSSRIKSILDRGRPVPVKILVTVKYVLKMSDHKQELYERFVKNVGRIPVDGDAVWFSSRFLSLYADVPEEDAERFLGQALLMAEYYIYYQYPSYAKKHLSAEMMDIFEVLSRLNKDLPGIRKEFLSSERSRSLLRGFEEPLEKSLREEHELDVLPGQKLDIGTLFSFVNSDNFSVFESFSYLGFSSSRYPFIRRYDGTPLTILHGSTKAQEIIDSGRLISQVDDPTYPGRSRNLKYVFFGSPYHHISRNPSDYLLGEEWFYGNAVFEFPYSVLHPDSQRIFHPRGKLFAHYLSNDRRDGDRDSIPEDIVQMGQYPVPLSAASRIYYANDAQKKKIEKMLAQRGLDIPLKSAEEADEIYRRMHEQGLEILDQYGDSYPDFMRSLGQLRDGLEEHLVERALKLLNRPALPDLLRSYLRQYAVFSLSELATSGRKADDPAMKNVEKQEEIDRFTDLQATDGTDMATGEIPAQVARLLQMPIFERLKDITGFNGLGADLTGAHKEFAVGLHNIRAMRLALGVAGSINKADAFNAGRQSPLDLGKVGFVAVTEDIGAMPYRHYFMRGEIGRKLEQVGFSAEEFAVRSLEEGGFVLDESLKNDLRHFGEKDEAKLKTLSPEAKVAIGAEHIEGVTEDLLFGLKYRLIDPKDINQSFRGVFSQKVLGEFSLALEDLNAGRSFDQIVLEIAGGVAKDMLRRAEGSSDVAAEFLAQAQAIKRLGRAKIIGPRIFRNDKVDPDVEQEKVARMLLPKFEALYQQALAAPRSEYEAVWSAIKTFSGLTEAQVRQLPDEGRSSSPIRDGELQGGIDIADIGLARTGSTHISFEDQAIREVMSGSFEGFAPVIVSLTPIESPLVLMGQ